MAPQEYCTNWRQVRVFIPDQHPGNFSSFHNANTRPLVQGGGLDTPFFISHYLWSDADSADTVIANLPPQYRFGPIADPTDSTKPWIDAQGNMITVHASIRFRWREDAAGHYEQQLRGIIPANCWFSDFREFIMPDGMAHGRFSDYPVVNVADNERRAHMVGEILHHNSRLYLDMLRNGANGAVSESSNDDLNYILKSLLQSVMHMILNLHGEKKVVGVYTDPQGNVSGRPL